MPTLDDLENTLSKIRTVKYGDYVMSDDHNLQTQCISIAKDILKDHDDKIKQLPFENGYLINDLIPKYDKVYNLGSENLKFLNAYSYYANSKYAYTDYLNADRFIDDVVPFLDLSLNIGASNLRWLSSFIGYGYFSHDLFKKGKSVITDPLKLFKFGHQYITYYDDLSGTEFDWQKIIYDTTINIGTDNFPILNVPLKCGDLLIMHARFHNTSTWDNTNVNWTSYFYRLLLEFKQAGNLIYYIDDYEGFSFYGSPYQSASTLGTCDMLYAIAPILDNINQVRFYLEIRCKASYSVSRTIRFRVFYNNYVFLLRPT